MNERIKELCKKAFLLTHEENDRHEQEEGEELNEIEFDNMFHEKFAELIVKECALQCVHNEDMDLIEQHFGVEE